MLKKPSKTGTRNFIWSAKTSQKRGIPLNRQFQAAVYSLHEYFELEKANNGPLMSVQCVRERVMAALKISKNTVSKIVQVGKSGEPFITPGKVRPHAAKIRTITSNTADAIREIIYDKSSQRLSITTADILDEIRKRNIDFGGMGETLRKVLHDLGFTYKIRNGLRFVIEQPHIIMKRIHFLRKYKENLDSGSRYPVFLDETWTFRNGTGKTRDWQDEDIRSCSMKKNDSGARYIIVHGGGKEGFIEGASLILCSEKKPKNYDDYHGDMNGIMFKKWFTEQFLPNLPRPSLIIMDNASYHSMKVEKQPTMSWSKLEMQMWLRQKNVAFDETMCKNELYIVCKQNKTAIKYELDELVRNTTDHEILRLPPYHSFYNPIELVWGLTKRYFDKHVGRNNDFTEPALLQIWDEALRYVDKEKWKNSCEHVEKRILIDYEREVLGDISHLLDDDGDDIEISSKAIDEDLLEEYDINGVTSSVRRSLLEQFEEFDLENPAEEHVEMDVIDVHSTDSEQLLDHESLDSLTHLGAINISQEETEAALRSIESGSDIIDTDVSLDVDFLVQECLGSSDDAVFADIFKIVVRVRDIKTLIPSAWVNDTIVNAYLRMIVKRGEPSLFACDTFFFPQLCVSYDKVKEWTKQVDIFSKEMMFIPIHLTNHWCLCIVNFQSRTITYYDSFNHKNEECLQVILRYLEDEHSSKKNVPLDKSWWKMEHAKDIPRQTNSSDCGVFICAYAESLSRRVQPAFEAHDMKSIRYKMVEEIMKSKLTSPAESLCRNEKISTISLGAFISGAPKKRRAKSQMRVAELCKKTRNFEMSTESKVQEQRTNVDGVLLYQSANIHQADKQFPPDRRNTQCTAISTYAVIVLPSSLEYISPKFLDDIIIKGDEYYVTCKTVKNIHQSYLSVDDLVSPVPVCGHDVEIEINPCGEGNYSMPQLTESVCAAINNCIRVCGSHYADFGFLFIGHSKTVSFKIIPRSTGYSFLMFNSHNVDTDNRFPKKQPLKSVARLFRCLNAESLAKLLIADSPRSYTFWQIYCIKKKV